MPKQDPKWRPIDKLHEDHFPVITAWSGELSTLAFLEHIDDWNELDDEEQARFDIFHSLKFIFHCDYCEFLNEAMEKTISAIPLQPMG